MKKKQIVNIERCKGIYGKLILRLIEINKPGKFVEWTNLYEKLGRNFSIKKNEVRETLAFLRDLGYIEISCKGVKLNYEVIQ